MSESIIGLAGKKIKQSDLTIKKARELLEAVKLSPFTSLIKTIKDEDENEIIIFEADIEVPQYPVNDIKSKEVIAVSFFKNDTQFPKVLTLRKDFPSLPHQLMEVNEFPRSLCLYNIPYEEVNLFWTGFIFVERIREWLKLSALGLLHQDDQPLEPLLAFDDGVIMIDIPSLADDIYIYIRHQDENGRLALIGSNRNIATSNKLFPAQMEVLRGTPQLHGIIKASPGNLLALSGFLKVGGIDLIGHLRKRLMEYKAANTKLDRRLLLFIELPKLRTAESTETSLEYFVFLTSDTLGTIGKKLGLWSDEAVGLGLGIIIGEKQNDEPLKNIAVTILRPVFNFGPNTGAYMNGTTLGRDTKILAIGVGALGSQILNNLVRSDIGQWKVIDSDLLLPHNLSRHTLTGLELMRPKVFGMAFFADSILPGKVIPINADVIKDIEKPEIQDAIKEAALIIDMSASSAVMRTLCDQKDRKRICSFFLNPSGDSFITIAEDHKLECPANILEGQYLRLILNTPDLHDHFNQDIQPFRYAAGCRDVSVVLPQDSISLAASIGSKFTKQLLLNDNAVISIWKTDINTLAVKRFDAEIHKPKQEHAGKWNVIYDDYVIQKVNTLREAKLPNETGGILIGNYDMQRRIISVLDIVPSPDDSYEYPTAYIRGIKGIGEDLKKIKQITAGGLQYIGEWHTHPKGCGPNMSNDDKILFSWMMDNMYKEGLPALMLIVGDRYSYYVSE